MKQRKMLHMYKCNLNELAIEWEKSAGEYSYRKKYELYTFRF